MMVFADANHPYNPPQMYMEPIGYAVNTGIFLIGIVVAYSGLFILRTYAVTTPFLTKDGEPIHSAKQWSRGSEPGLFLTSCGLVVSINQESAETAHVGYRIIKSTGATHRECVEREGKEILDGFSRRRSW